MRKSPPPLTLEQIQKEQAYLRRIASFTEKTSPEMKKIRARLMRLRKKAKARREEAANAQ